MGGRDAAPLTPSQHLSRAALTPDALARGSEVTSVSAAMYVSGVYRLGGRCRRSESISAVCPPAMVMMTRGGPEAE